MSFARYTRFTAWIAIAAILLAALAPGLARVLASPQQAMPWNAICTVGGMQTVPEALPDSGSGQHDGKVFKHCPFCLNQAGQIALPATPPGFALAMDAGAALRCFSVTTPSSRFACTAPQSRAPPVLS